MRLLDLKDLTAEHYKTFGQQPDITPAEKAEVIRLYMAELNVEDLQQYADWRNATPMEDLLIELEELQKQWDEQHP